MAGESSLETLVATEMQSRERELVIPSVTRREALQTEVRRLKAASEMRACDHQYWLRALPSTWMSRRGFPICNPNNSNLWFHLQPISFLQWSYKFNITKLTTEIIINEFLTFQYINKYQMLSILDSNPKFKRTKTYSYPLEFELQIWMNN